MTTDDIRERVNEVKASKDRLLRFRDRMMKRAMDIQKAISVKYLAAAVAAHQRLGLPLFEH